MTAPKTAAVFGGSGFIGRYVVERLADRGVVVRVVCRDPEDAAFLRPAGNVGQIVPMAASIRDPVGVARAVDGVDWVVNLVGILYERGRRTFASIHVDGARQVAFAAANAGASRMVHVSALGADPQSPSLYARSKAAGEAAVREAFPDATVLRPSVVFGPEDDFINRFAAMARFLPVLPVMGGAPGTATDKEGRMRLDLCADGGPKFQPVYVGDVADAIVAGLTRDDAKGQTYELGGPDILSLKQVYELILAKTNRRRCLVPVPLGLASVQAAFLQFLPDPPLTPDQVKLLGRDNVLSGEAPGLADLGISPTAAGPVLDTYMDRHRAGGRFTQPAA